MDNFFTIYFLSIVDGLGSALAEAGGLVGFSSLVILAILHFVRLVRAVDRQHYGNRDDNEKVIQYFDAFIKLAKTTTIAGLVVFSVGYLMPNRRALVEAYVIVEGSKLITAENSEKMGAAVVARFDRVLSIVEEAAGTVAKETTEESEKAE